MPRTADFRCYFSLKCKEEEGKSARCECYENELLGALAKFLHLTSVLCYSEIDFPDLASPFCFSPRYLTPGHFVSEVLFYQRK